MESESRTKLGIKNPKVKKALFITSLMIVPLASFAFFYVYVNFNSFFMAFQQIYTTAKGEQTVTWVGFDNFAAFFEQIRNSTGFGNAFINSIRNFWITFIIDIPLYVFLSYYLCKKMPLTKITSVIVMLPSVVSAYVYATSYQQLVDADGPLQNIMFALGYENFPSLLTDADYVNFNNLFFCMWVSFGSATLIFTNAINAIDKEILESSMVDGAGDARQFFTIVLPLIWPTFTTYVVTGLAGMFTWSGHILTFYPGQEASLQDRYPDLVGLGYWFTINLKNDGGAGFSNLPMIASSGLFITMISVPIIFGVRALMTKLDKTND